MNYAARQYDAMIESWLYTIIWKDIGMRIQRKLRN